MSLAGNERDHNHVAVYVLCRIQLVPPAISLNTNRPEVMVKARRIIHDLPDYRRCRISIETGAMPEPVNSGGSLGLAMDVFETLRTVGVQPYS